MVQGIGNDIIEISRVSNGIARHGAHFLDKIFTAAEQEYCNKYSDAAPYYAGRFAAKEAVVKALGTGFREGITWLDIEICNNELGKPFVVFSDQVNSTFKQPKVLVTISHCKEYATACAVWL